MNDENESGTADYKRAADFKRTAVLKRTACESRCMSLFQSCPKFTFTDYKNCIDLQDRCLASC